MRNRIPWAWACALGVLAGCFVEVPGARPADGGAGGTSLLTGGAGGTGGADGGSGGCANDTADCDGDGTCETDLANDRDNCTACGRNCLGASCVARRCQPIELRPGQTFPHQIAVGAEHVFWSNGGEGLGNGEIIRANLDGSARRTLASMAGKARGLTLDESNVFWVDANDGSLHRVARDTNSPDQVIVPGPGMMGESGEGGIVIDGGQVFWSFERGGLIRVANKNGNGATDLATMQPSPRQLAVLDGVLYFTVGAEPELRSVPISGGAVSVHTSEAELGPVSRSWGITRADGNIFFRASDWGAGLDGRLLRWSPSDMSMSLIAASPGAADLTSDATHLYFTSDEDNTVSKIPIAGGDVTVLATAQDNPTGIAVDDTAVYWTNRALGVPGGGTIMKVAK